MRITLVFIIIFSFLSSNLDAQEADEKQASTFNIVINQDNAFGFYPSVFGSFGLSDRLSFTYYSIFWTNPSYGNLVNGTDIWLEMGIGVGFPLLDDKIYLNPSLGTTHGRLLSDAPKGEIFEGLVPSIALFYLDERFEGEAFAAYYKVIKTKSANSGDYLLYWILPGVVLSPNISLGLHYESFVNTWLSEGEGSTFYQWFGGYFKFTVNDKYTFRFSAGTNTADNPQYSGQFYKLNVVIPLE